MNDFILSFKTVSLCSSTYPGTISIVQAGVQLRDWSAYVSRMLGSKTCTITAQLVKDFMKQYNWIFYPFL